MEYIEKHYGIPCSELEKYSQTLINSGYEDTPARRLVNTRDDLKCAKVEIDIPGIELEIE